MIGMGLSILYFSFKDFNWTYNNLLQILLKDIIGIIFALFFIGIAIYGVIITTVKKKIVCKLENIIDLRNIDDNYLFELLFKYRDKTYYYYIKENNHPYIKGNNYTLLVRNYNILSVLSETTKEIITKNNYWHLTYMPNGTSFPYNLLIIFYLFAFTFLIGTLVVLNNIFINDLTGKDFINNIISLIICFTIFIFCSWCIYNDYDMKKKNKDIKNTNF